ncbi:DUF3987 domain-containing protein [Pseudomonas sp. CAH-1]|uniref:DUF3987 domain-containing protein n=1 Tax=Pseudomonas sp. CAH-1 TaxID=2605744 RepID=UPI0012AD9364|nr:DUF3987 domain-containing protein [Pseudomonas sp. CAH-1]MRT64166.1 DUF3987 domain-containing protein [Pseudomonas sp. CAH-1]
MPRVKLGSKPAKQPDLFDQLSKSEEARETLKAMLAIRKMKANEWRGLMATPPNSLLESVVTAFYQKTDIPLEIPFFVTLHILSAHLLSHGVTVKFAGSALKPDLWSVILASSGAGKTYSSSFLETLCGVDETFPEPASAAKFVQDLSDHNNSLWVRDEFAQLLKAIETQPHMAEMKDYLLRTYDGKKISRRTKKDVIEVENPALTIIGMTVLETFKNNVSPESMLDGFAQRFSYVIAKNDPDRTTRDFPIYDMEPYKKEISKRWNSTVNSVKHQEYVMGKEAEEAFKQAFESLFQDELEVPASFFRRIMFRSVKYALVYHVMLKKTAKTLDAEDMGWAARVCKMHLQDASELISHYNLPDFERIIQRAEEIRDECASEGKPFTAREIIRRMNAIKTASQATAIMQLITQ